MSLVAGVGCDDDGRGLPRAGPLLDEVGFVTAKDGATFDYCDADVVF